MEKWKRWINTRDEEYINKFINDLTKLKDLKYKEITPEPLSDTESEITYEDTGFTVPEAESDEEDNICEICGEICDEEKDVIFKCEECGSNPSHSECYDNGGQGSNLLSVQEGWACDDHYVPAHIADEWCSRG